MKKFLTTLFFVGITTIGFAQTKKVYGRASLMISEPGLTVFNCSGSEGTCFTLTKSYISDYWRIKVPDLNIDELVLSPFVNDQPVEALPDAQPGNDSDFTIKFEFEE